IERNDNNQAEVNYHVETGTAFVIDSISERISTPIVDTLYNKSIKQNSFIKKGEQYRTANFAQERDRISDELRNMGRYNSKKEYNQNGVNFPCENWTGICNESNYQNNSSPNCEYPLQ